MNVFLKFTKDIGFDVQKYEQLKNISDYELIMQLRAREKMSEWGALACSNDSLLVEYMDECVDVHFKIYLVK